VVHLRSDETLRRNSQKKKVANEKQLAHDISINESSSKRSGDLPTVDQVDSKKSIPWRPPVKLRRQQMAQQVDRIRTEANHASEPLASEAREALAQFLSTPAPMRNLKSITALAEYYKVSRMTLHRWQRDPAVLQRAETLSKRNWLPGVLLARSNYESTVRAQIKKAIRGDTKAARYVHEIAWTEAPPEKATRKEVTIEVVYADSPEPMNRPERIQQEAGSSSDPAPQ
jgi:hypothetical protein